MKRISICSWCGQPFDVEENAPELDVCGECEFIGQDMIGELTDDDLSYIKGDK